MGDEFLYLPALWRLQGFLNEKPDCGTYEAPFERVSSAEKKKKSVDLRREQVSRKSFFLE